MVPVLIIDELKAGTYMDERREEREELAALDREVEDLRREQEAAERFAADEALYTAWEIIDAGR